MTGKLKAVCSVLLICFSMASPVLASDLVTHGKPAAELILPADASYLEVRGSMDIRHFIHEMTGATLRVASKPSGEVVTRIFVGPTFATAFSDDLARLQGNDGYAIRQKGDDIYIFGSRPRSTFYGLMQFLQKNTDLIFARPNANFGTVYGQHESIAITQADILDIPVFPFRSTSGGHPPHPDTEYWGIRNGDSMPNRGFHVPKWDAVNYGSADLSSPLWDQFDEHPEYFAYDSLTQSRRKAGNYSGGLCLTYPGMARIWAQGIIDHGDAQPETVTYNGLAMFNRWFPIQMN